MAYTAPVVLGVLVLASASALVHSRYEARREFVALQKLQEQRTDLLTEWSRLQLEQSTLHGPRRIERIATRDLGMRKPRADELRIIPR